MQYTSISFNFTKIHKMCELWLFRIVRICFAILAFAASGRLGMTWERGEVDDLGTALGHIWTL